MQPELGPRWSKEKVQSVVALIERKTYRVKSVADDTGRDELS